MERTMSSCYIPENIMFNILSLLPVKPLLRFKSVCKLWLSIISHPKFIKTQLNNFKKQQANVPSSAIVVEHNGLKDRRLNLIDCRKDEVRLHQPPPQLNRMIRFVNSCNGLVCLADCDCNVICLWNPSTKWYKMLPNHNKPLSRYPIRMGFGFDSTSNDYKVLMILIYDNHAVNDDYYTYKLGAQMYSANADSWKELQSPEILQNFFSYYLSPVHAINEVLYLHCNDGLLSFDLHNEVFELCPFPYSLPYSRRRSCLLDFEGSAAMVFSEYVNDDIVHSLWTLDYSCGNVSRTKMFNLELECKMHYRVCSYLGVGQFVVKDDSDVYSFYDNEKKETRNFAWVIEDASVFKYIESLVSL